MPRTTDIGYGAAYWQTLDGGAGYKDSTMWADLAHIVHEVVGVDVVAGRDRAMSTRLLDVGCAFGFFVRHMHERGYDVRGLDYSEYAVEHAPKDMEAYVRRYDLTGDDPIVDWIVPDPRKPVTPKPFDVVTCFETLEHVPAQHADRAVGHLADALAPGGSLIATICVVGQPDVRSDPTHVTVVPREWWDERLLAAGLAPDDALCRQLRWFWLFSQHAGVFCYRKPE